MIKKTDVIHTSGKRKTAVARATLKQGTGKVFINKCLLQNVKPKLYALRIKEPLILSGELADKIDLNVNVFGGGFSSRADASRIAISNALVEFKPALKQIFLDYDRAMLISDVRARESSKPNSQGSARSKRQKSYR